MKVERLKKAVFAVEKNSVINVYFIVRKDLQG